MRLCDPCSPQFSRCSSSARSVRRLTLPRASRSAARFFLFFFSDTAPTDIYTLSLHDALPICDQSLGDDRQAGLREQTLRVVFVNRPARADRKSTRLNSSHRCISYAVFCLKKKKKEGRDLERGRVLTHRLTALGQCDCAIRAPLSSLAAVLPHAPSVVLLYPVRRALLHVSFFFFLVIRRPPISTLFPYTTLFRSATSRSATTGRPACASRRFASYS